MLVLVKTGILTFQSYLLFQKWKNTLIVYEMAYEILYVQNNGIFKKQRIIHINDSRNENHGLTCFI